MNKHQRIWERAHRFKESQRRVEREIREWAKEGVTLTPSTLRQRLRG